MRIKKAVLTVIFTLGIIFTAVLFSSAVPDISAASAVVMLMQTGEVLYEKNAHTPRSMASTTKIMTAYLSLLYGQPDKTVTVTGKMLTEGTSVGLHAGDRITLLNLVYGMLLQSGNDAANAAACAVAGSTESFARLMNRCAADIGMKDTRFVTPSGLDADGHCTTAYDMALLTRR
ncbi:MAG: serine hydrolase, partial [Clostridia bacterium]|nr:serine hydrolase [Clostridia bacterium]